MEVVDAVKLFLEFIDKDINAFAEYAKCGSIFIPYKAGVEHWNELKETINKDRCVKVRGYGNNRDKNNLSSQQKMLQGFYQACLGLNQIEIDPNNNEEPKKIIEKLTKHVKGKTLLNYKVSHVWERKLNPWAFTAPWNIVFTPIFVDPLTGHEAKGALVDNVKKGIRGKVLSEYAQEIDEYNRIMVKYNEKIVEYVKNIPNSQNLGKRQLDMLKRRIVEDFRQVNLVD